MLLLRLDKESMDMNCACSSIAVKYENFTFPLMPALVATFFLWNLAGQKIRGGKFLFYRPSTWAFSFSVLCNKAGAVN